MRTEQPIVFVVDDDEAMCESLQWLLESDGLTVRTFHSAEEFLSSYRPEQPGCLVLDVRMHGLSGLDLQSQLARRGAAIPVIIITGHGDVPMAVRAMKSGVADFLEKPVSDKVLLQRIHAALDLDRRQRESDRERREIRTAIEQLTAREREVLNLVVGGKANKQIAAELGIREKTVEVHRKHVMQKMSVHTVVDLVRIVLAARGQGESSDADAAPDNPV